MNPPRRFFLKDTDISEKTMGRCGFCSLISNLLRRVMCVSSRRGSSDSYYREIGDQDTVKIDDHCSEYSNNGEAAEIEIHPEIHESPFHIGDMRTKTPSRFMTINKRRKNKLLTNCLKENCALLDDLSLGMVERMLKKSAQWNFNAFTLDRLTGGRCLPVLSMYLFQEYGLISHFNLDAAKLWKLFSLIEDGYHSSNPYHNAVHAADVTQAMHCFLKQKKIYENLQPIEIMASIIAAAAHDLDHPGVNQPFLIATSNHLAKLYNNTSVLENHHWRSAVSCIKESGLLDHMVNVRDELEEKVRALIMATDITRQQEYLSLFKNHLDMNTLDMTSAEHRLLVLQIALKCADISNPCRPWKISRKWSLKVCQEFFRQGDYERKLNLPRTALCDRHCTSIPRIQSGFFKFIVKPLIHEWHRFLNNDLSAQMLENLNCNQQKWEKLLDQEKKAQEARNEAPASEVVEEIDTSSSLDISDSAELLLPPRRCSLNTVKPPGSLKKQFRRFSVPLNVFHDSKFKNKGDKNHAATVVEPQKSGTASCAGSQHSMHSQQTPEKVLSAEKLVLESSIASITTAMQASRLNTVIKDGGTWKLVRQQTFPPLEITRDHTLKTRSLHTSKEDTAHAARIKVELPKFDLRAYFVEGKLMNSFTKVETNIVENASQNNNVTPINVSRGNQKQSETKRRESIAVGNQLRDNLTSVQLGALESDPLLRRRKSMPAEALIFSPKEIKVREVATTLPQLLRRTVSGKESWTRRRGSAPSPIVSSELPGLTSINSLRHSVNGGRRKLNPIVSCQQWFAQTTYSVQERPLSQMPRRSSLPVEVMTGI